MSAGGALTHDKEKLSWTKESLWGGPSRTLRLAFLGTIGPQLAVYFSFVFRDPAEDRWVPLFVDHAESLAAALPTHRRWPEAVRRGATEVHVIRQHDPQISGGCEGLANPALGGHG